MTKEKLQELNKLFNEIEFLKEERRKIETVNFSSHHLKNDKLSIELLFERSKIRRKIIPGILPIDEQTIQEMYYNGLVKKIEKLEKEFDNL